MTEAVTIELTSVVGAAADLNGRGLIRLGTANGEVTLAVPRVLLAVLVRAVAQADAISSSATCRPQALQPVSRWDFGALDNGDAVLAFSAPSGARFLFEIPQNQLRHIAETLAVMAGATLQPTVIPRRKS